MTAMLDFRLPVTFFSIRYITIDFLDPENMGEAVGILSLSAIDPEL
jgi:hypothetical protein